MSVLLNTSLGDIVIDLHTEQCPLTTKNFLKLCKIKYYNNCLFHTVQKDFLVQTGDPTGTGSGGDSIYKFLYGEQARFFNDEIHQNLKHDKIGVVAMASAGENLNASQFYITTRADVDYLDGKHTVFGVVAEGEKVLMKINEAFVDEQNRPFKNIRIKHTYILYDPFDDPVQLAEHIPENSPVLPLPAKGEEVRLEDDWVPLDEQMDAEELDKSLRRKEAHSRAVVLEMIGDIPDAEIKPPENVLFVCKLNPVTQDEDLETIFSRFGKIVSADIIRDYKTGDSLCYAFIEFETQEACEAAYFKMDNVLIDDRRIHVDFSQSVSRLWTRYRRFGKRDADDGKGSSFAPHSADKGCFKCGASGHFARDCPGENEENIPKEKAKYEVKGRDGQHGGSAKRYDMVFEDTAGAENQQKQRHHKSSNTADTENERGRHHHKSTRDDGRNRYYESHGSRHKNNDSQENRSHHLQRKGSKRCRETDDLDESQNKSWRYRELDGKDDRTRRHSPGSSRHLERKGGGEEARSERSRGHRDRDDIHLDRHRSPKDRYSPEAYRSSKHHASPDSQRGHGETVREDRSSPMRRDDRNGKHDLSGSGNKLRESSRKDGYFRDSERNHDRHRK